MININLSYWLIIFFMHQLLKKYLMNSIPYKVIKVNIFLQNLIIIIIKFIYYFLILKEYIN